MPENTPAIWLVRNDASPRRMRRVDGELRTTIGFDTLLHGRVQSLRLSEAKRIEVLAPYAPPARRLALFCAGAVIGSAAGGFAGAGGAMIMAFLALTFSAVAAVVGGQTEASGRLARIDLTDGGAAIISYRLEDEDDVRRLFHSAEWLDHNKADPSAQLLPDERRHADFLRIGIVLAAAALSAIVLMLIEWTNAQQAGIIALPAEILTYTAAAVAAFVALAAWTMLLMIWRR